MLYSSLKMQMYLDLSTKTIKFFLNEPFFYNSNYLWINLINHGIDPSFSVKISHIFSQTQVHSEHSDRYYDKQSNPHSINLLTEPVPSSVGSLYL